MSRYLRVRMALPDETLTIRAENDKRLERPVLDVFSDALREGAAVVVESGRNRKLWINPAHVAYIEEKPDA